MSKNKIATPFLALALIGDLGATPAGASEVLTLEAAMAEARAEALEVEAAGLRAEAGDEGLRQARSYRLPQVRLMEVWSRTDSPAEAFGLLLNQESFSFADFVAGDPNDPETIENALTRLEVELALYAGGEIKGRIRQAELATEALRGQATRVGDQAALSAAEAYIRLTQARERAALLERTLDTVTAHVELARAYVGQGLLVRSELLRAEVEAARVRELLVEAEGQARVALANLAFRLGREREGDWALEALPRPTPLSEPLAEWLDASDARADLGAARARLEAGRLEESIRSAGRFPRVGLVARRDFYDDTLFGSGGDSTALMAVASLDLWSGGRHRAAAAAAGLEAEAAARDVERFRRGIHLEVRDAYERAVTARERQATADAVLTAAREAERITRKRFEQGVAKTLDVLDAVTALQEAETRELVARAEAHLASLRLAASAGRSPESALAKSAVPAAADEATETPMNDERTNR